MKYVRFWYMYRDYSNYKNHYSILFSNPSGRSLEEINAAIRKCLIEETWFLHSEWNVPDMHFEKTDWEDDHPLHEYNFLEESEDVDPNAETIDNFLSRISQLSTNFPIFPS